MDSGKIVVYGNIDPRLNILEKLSAMVSVIKASETDSFKHPGFKRALINEINEARILIAKKHYKPGLRELQKELLPKLENSSVSGKHHHKDWITDSDLQQRLFWSLQEIITLLKIVV